MNKILLTNTYRLKKRTQLQENISDDLLNPCILRAQEIYIQPTLGTSLYNKVMDDAYNKTITGIYKTLLNDYITPCLIEYSYYECLPYIQLRINNKSITRDNSSYSQSSGLEDLKYIRQNILNICQFYQERMIGYLKENYNNIPELQTNTEFSKMKTNLNNSYFSGVYIPKKKGCGF
jgi:hypothetical protein